MANYEKEPFFVLERKWNEKSKLPEKFKFQGGVHHKKCEVPIDNGTYGIEFFLEKTLPAFNRAGELFNWDWVESFSEFENCLEGNYKTSWQEILDEKFPEPLVGDPVDPDKDRSQGENFKKAIDMLVCKILDNKKPRDVQYIYLSPGGDYNVYKDLLTSPSNHKVRFKEMLRLSKMLPAGNIPDPNEDQALEWYYMTYHKQDRDKFVSSGKKLEDTGMSIDSVTEYFQALWLQKKADGTLEAQEVERLRRKARRTYQTGLRSMSESRQKTSARSYEQHARNYERRGGRGYGSYYERRSEHRDGSRSRSYDASRASDRGRGHAERKPHPAKHIPESEVCRRHSTPDQKANHTWAECRENPNNKAMVKPKASSDSRKNHQSHHVDHDSRFNSDAESEQSDNSHHDTDVDGSRSSDTEADNYALLCSGKEPKKKRARFVTPVATVMESTIARSDEDEMDMKEEAMDAFDLA